MNKIKFSLGLFVLFSLLAFSAGANAQNSESKTVACLNPQSTQQTIEGWGVSLCWWANMCGRWPDDKVDKLIELLTAEDGLNYNIFRYNIGGGDDPSHYNGHMTKGKGKRAEMDGFKASEKSAYDWTKDPGQRKVLKKIKEVRPDAIFEAFSNSPPYWMTYSGCSAGHTDARKDNLKPEYYGKFCDYLIDVCKHFRDEYGIEFKTLDPFNEPNTNYWKANGGQEGCHFSPETQVKLIRVLYPKLKASGLNTVMSACDETSVTTAIAEMQLYMSEKDIIPMLGQFNVHTYSGGPMDKANLRDLVKKSGLPFWMSETGSGGSGIGGNLNLAQRMFDDLNYLMPQAWIDWQFVEEGNDQWCLVKGEFANQKYNIVKNYYIRMQVSRFIKQGYTLLTTGRSDLLAAISPDKKEVVAVMLNTGIGRKSFELDLSLFGTVDSHVRFYVTNSKKNCEQNDGDYVADKKFSYTLGGQEIATAIFSVDEAKGVGCFDNGMACMIVPRSASSILSANADGLSLKNLSVGDSVQYWQFIPFADGTYSICYSQNGKKKALFDDGTYYLKVSDLNENEKAQKFRITEIDHNCYTIQSVINNKLLDLEGQKTDVGTKVGVWASGKDGANAHRQWRIVPYAFANEIVIDKTSVRSEALSPVKVITADKVITILNPEQSVISVNVISADGKVVYQCAETRSSRVEASLPDGVYAVMVCCDGVYNVTKTVFR